MRRIPLMLAALMASLHAASADHALAAGGGGGGGASTPSASTPAYDPALEYQRGTAAYRAGDFATAAGHFRKVVAAAPREASGHYLLGASYLGLGDAKKAAKPLAKAVKLDGQMVEARRDLGIALARLNQPAKAQTQLDALLAMQAACGSDCADAAKLGSAVTALQAAMAGGAQASLGAAPTLRFADAAAVDAAYVTAVALIQDQRYGDAIATLNAARWAAGPHPDILTYLGFANRKLGRFAEAEDHYRAALAIFPDHRGALEYYGELKLERGNVRGAKAHLARLETICAFGCVEADELRRRIVEAGSSAS